MSRTDGASSSHFLRASLADTIYNTDTAQAQPKMLQNKHPRHPKQHSPVTFLSF